MPQLNVLFKEQKYARLNQLRQQYSLLVNVILPKQMDRKDLHGHCYARIVLDFIYQDRWDRVNPATPAFLKLNTIQLSSAIHRMNEWIVDPELLEKDNVKSKLYRR